MDAAHAERRHLGEILVQEGFITSDALAGALERQAATQRPLGEVVVELGLVSPGAVANALAEQHGGILRTEYGISVGLHPGGSHGPEPKPEPEPEPEAAPEPEPGPDVLEPWRAALAERDRLLLELSETIRARDAELAARPDPVPAPAHDGAAERVAELEGERAELLSELDTLRLRLSEAASTAEERGQELAEARAAQAKLAEANAALEAAAAAARETGAELGEARRALGRALADADAARAALADRSQELAQLQGRLEELEARSAPEPEPAPEPAHVLLLPGRKGWELVERDGPAPARGERVELDAVYVVARLGPSPLPAGARTCAFLERA